VVKRTGEKHNRSTLEFKENDIASKYIRENFEPSDRLAVVLLNKRSGAVIQRLAPAEKIAATDFQKWLRYMNYENKYEVYVSMNTLKANGHGRTKDDVAEIRHIYLDLDRDGEGALDRLIKREDLPKPNYVLYTSPGKYQVVWKVDGFTKEQAEELQRGLAAESGADPAATDSSRVLRLPGWLNHKYDTPHMVTAERISEKTYKLDEFPRAQAREQYGYRDRDSVKTDPRNRTPPRLLSQSERDWAFAKEALRRGASRESVIATLASYRRFDKPNSKYYAELTVEKASRSLEGQDRLREVKTSGRDR
jgi:RepB DNA-primase from phage plasmid